MIRARRNIEAVMEGQSQSIAGTVKSLETITQTEQPIARALPCLKQNMTLELYVPDRLDRALCSRRKLSNGLEILLS